MADADTTTDILNRAGYTNIALHRCDEPITIGGDIARDALASELADLATYAGVIGDASTWIISATNPGHHHA